MTEAWMFPGQGAQVPGMGRELYEAFPECRALFERASDVLRVDLARICFSGSAEELTRSDRAQPAIFTVSAAALAAWRRIRPNEGGAAPSAGLSSGEWAGLYAAGVIDFETGVRLLAERGRLMQAACEMNPGGMVSVIGLDRPALEAVCKRTGAWIANLNSPKQTVLSAPQKALGDVETAAQAEGARRVIRLNVAGAFHSPLMAPAAKGLAEKLRPVSFFASESPVYSNVTGALHETPEAIKTRMVEQITASVHWVDTVRAMKRAGADTFVELGPGRVLSGLVKRIDKTARLHTIHDVSSLEAAAGRSG